MIFVAQRERHESVCQIYIYIYIYASEQHSYRGARPVVCFQEAFKIFKMYSRERKLGKIILESMRVLTNLPLWTHVIVITCDCFQVLLLKSVYMPYFLYNRYIALWSVYHSHGVQFVKDIHLYSLRHKILIFRVFANLPGLRSISLVCKANLPGYHSEGLTCMLFFLSVCLSFTSLFFLPHVFLYFW